MDANVNIQVSGMNTGHMEKAAWGYMYFILRQIGDWKENAKAVYGMWDALLAPVNTDGNRAIMVEYDIDYPSSTGMPGFLADWCRSLSTG